MLLLQFNTFTTAHIFYRAPILPSSLYNQLYSIAIWASLVAQLVKNLPAMRESWVQSLGWEDPLEKGKATQSGILENSMEYF